MRIDGNPNLRLHHAHDASDTAKKNRIQTSRADAGRTHSETSAKLSISSLELIKQLKDVDELRGDRVAEVRQQISRGVYQGPDAAQRTAEAILAQLAE